MLKKSFFVVYMPILCKIAAPAVTFHLAFPIYLQ